jgi:arylformamidase
MRMIDIGGSLRHHMWSVDGNPFPLVKVAELPTLSFLPYHVYAQEVSMPMQVSTYLETAAHLYPDRIKIDELPLERLFTEAVVLKVPRDAGEQITSELLIQALQSQDVCLSRGDSLLVGTGWDKGWDELDYFQDAPYFTAEAIEWIIEQEVGILGADTPQWDSRKDPQGFFPKFFESEILLLAPLVNLFEVSQPRVRLITLPLKVAGVCAAPCRAIVIEE